MELQGGESLQVHPVRKVLDDVGCVFVLVQAEPDYGQLGKARLEVVEQKGQVLHNKLIGEINAIVCVGLLAELRLSVLVFVRGFGQELVEVLLVGALVALLRVGWQLDILRLHQAEAKFIQELAEN